MNQSKRSRSPTGTRAAKASNKTAANESSPMQVDNKTVKAPKLSEEDVGLITGMGYLEANVRRCLI